jgi:hypothetical protein
MNGTSILAMAALVVACMVSAFSLFTEKPEREIIIDAPLRRYRKPVLYVFTGLTLVFGGWQILKADKESRDSEKKHAAEREADGKQHSDDQAQIARLQSRVEAGNAMLERILVTLNQPQVISTGASGQPAVRLSWKPNETVGVVGYNIYRVEEANGKMSRLNSVPLSTPSYVDERVIPGSIYSYMATAVNSAGAESPHSNKIEVTIPN